MMMSSNHDCLHENQIQGQSRKIAELETKAEYKEEAIKDLKEDMKELKSDIKDVNDKMDKLNSSINKFILKSVNDDNKIMKAINAQDNRITALESRQDTIYKLLIAIPSIVALLGIVAAYIAWIH